MVPRFLISLIQIQALVVGQKGGKGPVLLLQTADGQHNGRVDLIPAAHALKGLFLHNPGQLIQGSL